MVIHINYLLLRCLINPTESDSKRWWYSEGLDGLGYSTPFAPPQPWEEMMGQWPEYKGKEVSFFMEGGDKGERWREMNQS